MRKTNRLLFLTICVLVSNFSSSGTVRAPVKDVKVPSGRTADLWVGVNVAGKIHYAIRTKDGSNQMRMWWIMKPLGNVRQLGMLTGNGSLDIPAKLKGSISAKLRGKASSDTVVYIGENVAVDSSVTFKW